MYVSFPPTHPTQSSLLIDPVHQTISTTHPPTHPPIPQTPQRLQTIESCDSIIVLKNGVVVERGTHDDLLAREGVYAAFRSQQICQEQSKVTGTGSGI